MKRVWIFLVMVMVVLAGSNTADAKAKAAKVKAPTATKQLTITEGKSKGVKLRGSYIVTKTFKSTDRDVASVSKKGIVTARSEGKCQIKITVKYLKKKKAKKKFTKKLVTKITVEKKKESESTSTAPDNNTEGGQKEATDTFCPRNPDGVHEWKHSMYEDGPALVVNGHTFKRCWWCDILFDEQEGKVIAAHCQVSDDGLHSWRYDSAEASTCTKEGYTAHFWCDECELIIGKQVIKALGHDYQLAETVTMSKERQGYTLYTCSRCSESKKENVVDYNPTEEQVYNDIMAMQAQYPEGTPWGYDTKYYSDSEGRYIWACGGFAQLLSDAAFGYLPENLLGNIDNVRVGDVIWYEWFNADGSYGASHAVIVLAVDGDTVTIAEGNHGGKVHWGRKISISEIRDNVTSVYTRYPDLMPKIAA